MSGRNRQRSPSRQRSPNRQMSPNRQQTRSPNRQQIRSPNRQTNNVNVNNYNRYGGRYGAGGLLLGTTAGLALGATAANSNQNNTTVTYPYYQSPYYGYQQYPTQYRY